MSSKEQKTPEGQAPEEIIMDQHEEVEAVESDASAEQVDPRDGAAVAHSGHRTVSGYLTGVCVISGRFLPYRLNHW